MKISIPTVVRPIHLSDYAPEYGDQVVQMWVNPPREKRLAYAHIIEDFGRVSDALKATEDADEIAKLAKEIEALGRQIYAWYAEMWSEGGDEWTVDDVQELADTAFDADPGLWSFLQERSMEVMGEYRRRKKVSTPEPQG